MSWLRKAASWIIAGLGVVAGALGVAAWWHERQRRRSLGASATELAQRNLELEKAKALAETAKVETAAVELVTEADRDAAKEVDRATDSHDLVSHLVDVDSGPD